MKKVAKRVLICFLLVISVWCGTLFADRQKLNQELIRLHVVANSDSEKDQTVKLQVRDAITQSIQEDMKSVANIEEAKAYLQENLPKLQSIANSALSAAGTDQTAVVTLCEEAFDTRYYDTFRLPAGVYQALRITIGEGAGQNWWCVAFPTLCLPATGAGFEAAAVEAGFSSGLSSTLRGEDGYEVRFYLLDALGKLENILFEE